MENAIAMSKGMFAIALYDKKEQELFLLRDRVGEKPLYYGFIGKDVFAFASEIGSIAVLDGFRNDIQTDILDIYFTHGYIPAPYSIYKDIYKLEPGTMLNIKFPYEKKIYPLPRSGLCGKRQRGGRGTCFREAGKKRRKSWKGF